MKRIARPGSAGLAQWSRRRADDVRPFAVHAIRGRGVQLIADQMYGYMVALQPPDTVAVKITEAVGRRRNVPLNGDIVQTARALGISFGD